MQMNRLLLFLCFIGIGANAQISIQGSVTSARGESLKNVEIQFNEKKAYTDKNGRYQIVLAESGQYDISIDFPLYEPWLESKYLSQNETINFILEPEIIQLSTSLILHQHEAKVENKEVVNRQFLQNEFAGSLAKTLEKIPGVQSMEIGSGTSKPVIRGLGFNRISVTENGVKQEGQQWGADHGLEISPWAIEKIEIIKGSGALQYGSDAIGGVISIQNNVKPAKHSFNGHFIGIGRSANQSLGGAVKIQKRYENFYWKFSSNYTDFADYEIPTESIRYLSRNIPIYNSRLKNTAGNELSTSVQLGYDTHELENTFNFSLYQQKLGFFPGAHGVPDLSRVEDDGDRRNIGFPFQKVQHLKFQNETILPFGESELKFSLGFQNNHRQEFSEFHTHYGNSHTPPLVDPNLELDFNLSTYDAHLKFEHTILRNWESVLGIQSQIQQNQIKGYSFLLPEFTKQNFAGFWTNNWKFHEKWNLNFGIRLDYTKLSITEFFDDYLHQFLIQNGHTNENAEILAQRSEALSNDYWNLNYAIGALYQPTSNLDFNFNLSSNFRVPNAIELASNGIHHGSFRHEKGNPNLDPEKGWSSDLKITYHPDSWNFIFNPYFYYFQNYIFLQPTVQFSPLPHGGQIYQYNQTEAFITGMEATIEKKFWNRLNGIFSVEFLYNQQKDRDSKEKYPLPFSPPIQFFNEWDWEIISKGKTFENLHFSVQVKHAMKQDRVAKNEEETGSSTLFGAKIQSKLKLGKFQSDIILSGQNLFNQTYFNHMSYYRALEIPEMGRNIQLIIQIPF